MKGTIRGIAFKVNLLHTLRSLVPQAAPVLVLGARSSNMENMDPLDRIRGGPCFISRTASQVWTNEGESLQKAYIP